MTLVTRKLSGKPPWPIVLLAGGEKVGKTWAAVQASTSPLVAGCLWFSMGEDEPDEYALIPGFDGDRFDLVEHDGTYRGLLAALIEAGGMPQRDKQARPYLWVLDSGSRTWDLLSGMAQREANQRRKAGELDECRITPDLWNIANDRWGHILDTFRGHAGPSIITSRMETVMVVDGNGNPTKDKQSKVLAQKRLPYDAGSIVEMPARGEAVLSGTRSVKLAQLQPRVKFPDFTFDSLWRRLGLDEGAGERTHTGIDPDDKPAMEADTARAELLALCETNGWAPQDVAAEYADLADGAPLREATNAAAIRTFTDDLVKRRTTESEPA